MFFCKGHGRIEPDNGKFLCHVEDGLDHCLTDLGVEIIELGRIIPGHAGPIVSVVDEPFVSRLPVNGFEDDRRVGAIVVVIFEKDRKPPVRREVRSVIGIPGKRIVVEGDEPVRVIDHPP